MKRFILFYSLIMLTGIAKCIQIEQFSVFEIELKGPSSGKPFREVTLSSEFRSMNRSFFCEGFYDGDGIFKIRFHA